MNWYVLKQDPDPLRLRHTSRNEAKAGPAKLACSHVKNDQVSIVLHGHTSVVPKRFVCAVGAFGDPQSPSERIMKKTAVADNELQMHTPSPWIQRGTIRLFLICRPNDFFALLDYQIPIGLQY
jgi:hypothetical protein